MNVAELSAWERIYLAMQVGVRDPLLVERLSAEVRGLLDAESLLLLAALLAATTLGAAWGGPAAWVTELGVAAAGLWYLGRDMITIASNTYEFVRLANAARTDDEIKAAGREFALALSRLGSTALMGLLSAGAFKAARSLLVPRLKKLVGTRAVEAKAPGETKPAETKAAADTKPPPQSETPQTSVSKKVATTLGEAGVARPVAEASLAAVFLPLGLLGAVGVGAVLLLRRRSQEVTVRVQSAA